MLEYNALIINGVSSASFPFLVIVEKNAAPTMAKRKDIFRSSDYMSGQQVQSIDAWDNVEKEYSLYLHKPTGDQIRQFKKWLAPRGEFKSADDPNIIRRYDSVTFTSEELDAIDGYHVKLTFSCSPFEFEDNSSRVSVEGSIYNHTNAPMYPIIYLRANIATETWLQIGKQRMVFPKGIQGNIVIECLYRHQNVGIENGGLINHLVKGPFFEIQPGTSQVTYGPGIYNIEMYTRWGWL